ncbi:MAG: molybdopterin-dependent oxidoreductase [Chloroflexota bacterium]
MVDTVERAQLSQVGKRAPKVDAAKLATGRAAFGDDVQIRDMLHVKLLSSPHAHARIAQIDLSAALAMPGVHAAISHHDVPRIPYTSAGQSWPEPSPYDMYILDRKARFVGDVVAAVAAETPREAELAVAAIEVEYDILPAVLDMREAMSVGAPIIHDEEDSTGIADPSRNLAGQILAQVGDVDRGFELADFVVDNEYSVQYQQHANLEPHVTICWLDEDDRLVVRTSTQIPYHCRRMLAGALGIPVRRIRVVKPRVGGGFGNKQEMISEPLAALLALKTGRPVKLEFSRRDEFTISRMRHPQYLRLRTGLRDDGSIVAHSMSVLSNTGAYGSHAVTVTGNTGTKTLPLYPAENMRLQADIVYTNLPVAGAFRGYGAPQGFFAMEVQIDEVAERLGVDPLAFRADHHIRTGDVDRLGTRAGEGAARAPRIIRSCGLAECMQRGAAAIGWDHKRGKTGTGPLRRGVGMCILMQGSGVAGDELAGAAIKLNEDGSFHIMVGSADIGTGSDTTLTQIAAEVLTVPLEYIVLKSGDTDDISFDYGAYASSTAYITGTCVLRAAEDMRRQLMELAGLLLEVERNALSIGDGQVVAPDGRRISMSEIALASLYGRHRQVLIGRGSFATDESPPPFAAIFAEVEVDTETGQIRPLHLVAAVDVGRALNPAICEGQVEGAVAQGLGYALTEEIVIGPDGRVLNPNFMDYKIFCSDDMPRLTTILVEDREPTGPFGAKSVAEIGINGPAPAIANAVYDAVGIRLRSLPMTAEKVLAALDERDSTTPHRTCFPFTTDFYPAQPHPSRSASRSDPSCE